MLLSMRPADLLRAVRRRQGLTQQALARAAGTSQPVVSAYEAGRRDPTHITLARLIAAAGEELMISARPFARDLPPPTDEQEHARRLVDVLSLADAIPARPRSRTLRAPRIVSR